LQLLVLFLARTLRQVAGAPGDGKVYWSDKDLNKIQRANLDGTSVEDFITTGVSKPQGIAVDEVNEHVYWCDRGTSTLKRARLHDGLDVETFMDTAQTGGVPIGMVIDTQVTGRVYWSTMLGGPIKKAFLNGTDVRDVLPESSGGGAFTTHMIAVDLTALQILWVEADPILPGIYKTDTTGYNQIAAGMPGSNYYVVIDGIVDGNIFTPEGLIVDVPNNYIYFSDSNLDVIQRRALDGTNGVDIVTSTKGKGLAHDHVENTLYWADEATNSISMVDLDTATLPLVSGAGQQIITGLSSPFGITVCQICEDYTTSTLTTTTLTTTTNTNTSTTETTSSSSTTTLTSTTTTSTTNTSTTMSTTTTTHTNTTTTNTITTTTNTTTTITTSSSTTSTFTSSTTSTSTTTTTLTSSTTTTTTFTSTTTTTLTTSTSSTSTTTVTLTSTTNTSTTTSTFTTSTTTTFTTMTGTNTSTTTSTTTSTSTTNTTSSTTYTSTSSTTNTTTMTSVTFSYTSSTTTTTTSTTTPDPNTTVTFTTRTVTTTVSAPPGFPFAERRVWMASVGLMTIGIVFGVVLLCAGCIYISAFKCLGPRLMINHIRPEPQAQNGGKMPKVHAKVRSPHKLDMETLEMLIGGVTCDQVYITSQRVSGIWPCRSYVATIMGVAPTKVLKGPPGWVGVEIVHGDLLVLEPEAFKRETLFELAKPSLDELVLEESMAAGIMINSPMSQAQTAKASNASTPSSLTRRSIPENETEQPPFIRINVRCPNGFVFCDGDYHLQDMAETDEGPKWCKDGDRFDFLLHFVGECRETVTGWTTIGRWYVEQVEKGVRIGESEDNRLLRSRECEEGEMPYWVRGSWQRRENAPEVAHASLADWVDDSDLKVRGPTLMNDENSPSSTPLSAAARVFNFLPTPRTPKPRSPVANKSPPHSASSRRTVAV